MTDSWKQAQYFDLATQYYAAGRFACFGMLIPVCGNLLHHAVEMCLKGFLSATMTKSELKKISHDLITAWGAFKSRVNDSTLDRFDEVVAELDQFEDLRYPEQMRIKGAQIFVTHSTIPLPQLGSGSPQLPTYRLSLGLIDELIETIFVASNMNMSGFVAQHNADARNFLSKKNREAFAGGHNNS